MVRPTSQLNQLDAHCVDPFALPHRVKLHLGLHNLTMVFKGTSDDANRVLIHELLELSTRPIGRQRRGSTPGPASVDGPGQGGPDKRAG